MAWSNGGGAYLAQKSIRSSRLSYVYVPPHCRNDGMPTFSNVNSFMSSNGSAQSGLASSNPYGSRQRTWGGSSNGRLGGGRGHGRGRRFTRPEEIDDTESNPYLNHDGFGIPDQFVTSEIKGEGTDICGINFDAYEDIPVEVSGCDIPPIGEYLRRNRVE